MCVCVCVCVFAVDDRSVLIPRRARCVGAGGPAWRLGWPGPVAPPRNAHSQPSRDSPCRQPYWPHIIQELTAAAGSLHVGCSCMAAGGPAAPAGSGPSIVTTCRGPTSARADDRWLQPPGARPRLRLARPRHDERYPCEAVIKRPALALHPVLAHCPERITGAPV